MGSAHTHRGCRIIIDRMASVLVNSVQHHPANRSGRDFVVGDLHGCVDALRYLLRVIAFDPARDRLFSVGDLVDRGEHSELALALLDKPWFFAVLGNHEDTLCAVADGRLRRQWWYGIGGIWAAQLSDERLQHYAEIVRGLPLVRVVGSGKERFNILHAEFFGTDAELDAGNFSADTRQQIAVGPRPGVGQRRSAAAARSLADLLRPHADARHQAGRLTGVHRHRCVRAGRQAHDRGAAGVAALVGLDRRGPRGRRGGAGAALTAALATARAGHAQSI